MRWVYWLEAEFKKGNNSWEFNEFDDIQPKSKFPYPFFTTDLCLPFINTQITNKNDYHNLNEKHYHTSFSVTTQVTSIMRMIDTSTIFKIQSTQSWIIEMVS